MTISPVGAPGPVTNFDTVGFCLEPLYYWIGAPLDRTEVDAGDNYRREMYREVLPSGVEVKVERDATFIFDFRNSHLRVNRAPSTARAEAKDRGNRALVCNTFLACLYSRFAAGMAADLPKMVVTPQAINRYGSIDSGIYSTGMGQHSFHSISHLRMSTSVTMNAGPYAAGLWAFRIHNIDLETLRAAFATFNDILTDETNRLTVYADLLLRACKAFEDVDFSVSQILSWALIEALLNRMWDEYLQWSEQHNAAASIPFISNDRKDYLHGPDFSASMITETLSLAGRLSFSMYRKLGPLRRARNNWIHFLKQVERKTAEESLSVAAEMLNDITGLNLQLVPGFTGY